MATKLSAVFICQKGELEIKASLLAASLRNIFTEKIIIYCGIPEITGMETHPEKTTIDFLESLEIQMHYFRNPIIEDEPGPVQGLQFSNKMFCFPDKLDEGKVVFLDSDMICLREPMLFNTIKSDFAGCQAFKSLDLDWKGLYTKTGIPEPQLREKSFLDGKFGHPYFNTGFFLADTRRLKNLLEEWKLLFREIRSLLIDEKHLHHSDQISLSMAIQKLNLSYEILSEKYNFPSGSLVIGNKPYFAHYHGPEKILRDPILYRATKKLAGKYPKLKSIAIMFNFWKDIIYGSNNSAILQLRYRLKKTFQRIINKGS